MDTKYKLHDKDGKAIFAKDAVFDESGRSVDEAVQAEISDAEWEQLKADADKAFKKQLKYYTASGTIAANKTLICHDDTRTWDFCPEYQGVTGITVEQMRELLRYYPKMEGRGSDYAFACAPIRFAIISGSNTGVTTKQPDHASEHWCTRDDFSYMFVGSDVEYIFIGGTWQSCLINNMTAFKGASKLRAIYGDFQSNANWVKDQTFDFSGCTSLEYLKLTAGGDSIGVNLKDSAKILYSSLKYIVTYGNKNKITVHPDVYKALTGEASEYPFNGGSREEWEALLELAGTKSVTFVSA